MPAYKDNKTNTWYSSFYYKDYDGNNKKKMKRGFSTKKEALEYENNFKSILDGSVDIQLKNFYEIYKKDKKPRMKLNTWLTKESIIETHILPYFADMKMNEIQPRHIVRWQNTLIEIEDDVGTKYSQTYLRTINTQLSAIFNHAVRFYGLKENPIHKSGSIGKKHSDEMNFWTREEFNKFIETQKNDSMAETAFLILFWCGLRIGEVLALSKSDFDFENNTINVSKSYQRIHGKDLITEPKTEKSNRIVTVPELIMDCFLQVEIPQFCKNFSSPRVGNFLGHYSNLFALTNTRFSQPIALPREQKQVAMVQDAV